MGIFSGNHTKTKVTQIDSFTSNLKLDYDSKVKYEEIFLTTLESWGLILSKERIRRTP